jgi:HAE1 family hydrophobic/amphiphilic exporter-1
VTKLIEFFIKNEHLNHILLLFLLFSGIVAYQNISKEIFPTVELDKIHISGSYTGASANNLDKMAVRDIESGVSSINHITEVNTVISPGKFTIILSLDKAADKIITLNKVQDAISSAKSNFPSDMNEPTAKLIDMQKALIKLSVGAEGKSFEELLEIGDDIKSKLSVIKHISEINIYGDSDKKIEINLDSQAIKAYGLNHSSVVSAIRNLSYIYPIGEVEDKANFVYVSTVNGKENVPQWNDTILNINGKRVYLGDIAHVKFYVPQDRTIATFNGKKSITLKIDKDEKGNSIALSKQLREKIKQLQPQYSDIQFVFFQDNSKPIKNRLSTITSNLTFGMILIFITMAILINRRTAVVVSMGVPFAFIIGLLFLYLNDYSINMVSLVGALLVIGIAVDDAVIVSENIQRHIDEGMEVHEAAIMGAKEVFLPILLATLTTVAAFSPLFMLSGTMGEFMKLIPIVVIAVLVGSLLESFFFLPLHAKSLLKQKSKSRDWSKVMKLYEKVLHFLIKYKKTFLFMFFILVPLLTFMAIKSSKFTFFPRSDGSQVFVSAKLKTDTTLEETSQIAMMLEKEFLNQKDELFIKSISTVSGYRKNLSNETERANNVFYLSMEFEEMVDENWVNKYINPVLNLSFDFNNPDKIRTKHSYQLVKILRKKVKEYRKKYGMLELGIIERKPGIVKTDIKINFLSSDDQKVMSAISKLTKTLESIDGVKDVTDNVKEGKLEYKIAINDYGESLGLSEGYIAGILNGYFLNSKKATTFGDSGVIDITTQDINKDDLNTLINFNIPLSDGRFVSLSDVVIFNKIQDYEKIEKEDGDIVKSISANVSKNIITANEVLAQIEPVLEEIRESGVGVKLKGEREKNREFKNDMMKALVVALFVICILLLFIFPKIKYVLMIISVIPFSILGAVIGHKLLGINLTMPSVVGMFGLAGVVINDGIIMLDFLQKAKNKAEFFVRATQRLRPIIITSVTTFVGLITLMFYAVGEAVIMQPLAISLGFGLIWGTVLNLFYLPALYGVVNGINEK